MDWSPDLHIEVTGYVLETLFDYADATGDADSRTRAIAMADWVLTQQQAPGSFNSLVFDTGMDLHGLIRAYQETADADYLNAAIDAGNWLVSEQEVDGSWLTDSGIPHAYHSRVAWSLLRLWQETADLDYKNAAIANLEWVLLQQNAVGWFANGDESAGNNDHPLTHFITYTARGLWESGIILGDNDYINAAKLTMDNYLTVVQANGSLGGGRFHNDWTVHSIAECLTGSAQTSGMWLKLYDYYGTAAYLTAAHNMNLYLMSIQGFSDNVGVNGGLHGSDPVGGAYMPNYVLSWATKFLADALYYEALYG